MSAGQVHRFRDSVVAWLGQGESVYMTAGEARAMARALTRAARSVERERFTDSGGNTAALAFTNDQYARPLDRRPDGRAKGARK